MSPEQRRRDLPKAIIKWYDIDREDKVACVVFENGNSSLIAEAMAEDGISVTCIPLSRFTRRGNRERGCEGDVDKGAYDMVVAVDVIEYALDAPGFLSHVKMLLKPEGTFLLAADNRLAIRYFCGDRDLYSGGNYDGIENYRHLSREERRKLRGRAYSRAELTGFLEQAGFFGHRFFSVFPRISNPQILLAEDYKPNEALDVRVFPEYNSPDTVFLFEEELYPDLMKNGLLHPMANGFFAECPLGRGYGPVNQVTLSGERGREHAMATIIRSDGLVEKRALYPEGQKRLNLLLDNHRYLTEHGVDLVHMERRGNSLVMPCVSGIPATDYFRELLEKDRDMFLAKLDIFWETILGSSEQLPVPEENGEVILERGYLDLVSLNCFYLEGKFVFYDQELYLEHVPAKSIMLRTIEFIYKFHDHLDGIPPRETVFGRYGIEKLKDIYGGHVSDFLNELRGDDGMWDYFRRGRREYGAVMKNRERMNYSSEEHDRIFRDIFYHARGRRLYLFGCGRYAKRFRETYRDTYPAAGYLDNDERLQGRVIDGLLVSGPDLLLEMNPEELKVIICVKDYLPIVKQLRREGVHNFSVYLPDVPQSPGYPEEMSGREGAGEH